MMTVEVARRITRAFQAMADSTRLAQDAWIRANRLEWEYPDRVLSDEQREEIEARQMGRTLADIDELPEAEVA